jgi:hypothetical protein
VRRVGFAPTAPDQSIDMTWATCTPRGPYARASEVGEDAREGRAIRDRDASAADSPDANPVISSLARDSLMAPSLPTVWYAMAGVAARGEAHSPFTTHRPNTRAVERLTPPEIGLNGSEGALVRVTSRADLRRDAEAPMAAPPAR